MELDHERLAAELMRALRGRRSQVAFSRRVGCSTNVAYAWESGRRAPTGTRFVAVAGAAGVDIDGAFERFAPRPTWASGVDWTDREVFARWLDGLRGRASVSEVARRAGRHRASVARWLAGEAEPRLPDLLRLVDALTDRVLDFVAGFADPTELRSVAEAWTRVQGARALAGASPWAAAVLLALELEDYRRQPHVSGWIGRRLGLPAGVEEECLAPRACGAGPPESRALRAGRCRDDRHPHLCDRAPSVLVVGRPGAALRRRARRARVEPRHGVGSG